MTSSWRHVDTSITRQKQYILSTIPSQHIIQHCLLLWKFKMFAWIHRMLAIFCQWKWVFPLTMEYLLYSCMAIMSAIRRGFHEPPVPITSYSRRWVTIPHCNGIVSRNFASIFLLTPVMKIQISRRSLTCLRRRNRHPRQLEVGWIGDIGLKTGSLGRTKPKGITGDLLNQRSRLKPIRYHSYNVS